MKARFSDEVLAWLQQHRTDDPLRVMLSKSPFVSVSNRVLATQIAGMKVAAAKYPLLLQYPQYQYPVKISLEQSSSMLTASYKADLVPEGSLVDLTGGMGIDAMHFAKLGREVTYVDIDSELCQLNTYNFQVLGYDIKVVCSSAEQYLAKATRYDTVYIDPSRRISGNKKTGMANLHPNVVVLQEGLRQVGSQVLIKLSPMQDISEVLATLQHVKHLHVVAVKEDVKELLVLVQAGSTANPQLTVAVLSEGGNTTVSRSMDVTAAIDIGPVSTYLYQPHPAVVKAAIHDQLATEQGLTKLHPNTQLYTGAELAKNYLGKIYLVLEPMQLRQKAAKAAGVGKYINIVSKNHPLSPAQISKKIAVQQGGDNYLVAVTTHDDKKQAYICQRIQ